MRAEFFHRDSPDRVVAAARWDGRAVHVETDDDDARAALDRIFRPSSVAVDDASSRPLGSSGQTVLEPGDLQWFLAAARVRAEREGVAVRFSTDRPGGWDPAGSYLPMGVWIARRQADEPAEAAGGTPSQ